MMMASVRWRFLLCLLALAVLAAPWPAGAATAPRPQDSWDVPMKVVIVRSSEKGCEPTCPEWVMAEGRIDKTTPELLASTYAKAAQRADGAKLPLIIRSPGGNIIAALQIGYFIRAHGIDVAVGTTGYEGCSPFGKTCKPNVDRDGVYRGRVSGGRSYCLSACPLVLAGGVRRVAEPTAVVAVHHWGYDTPAGDGKSKVKNASPPPEQKPAQQETAEDRFIRRVIGDYLKSIGNSEGLLDDMGKAPFSSIYLIKPKRRVALALVTAQDAPTLFTAASLCDGDAAPASCITEGLTADYRKALLAAGVRPGDKAMTAALARDARAGCEPVCAEFIVLKGVIRPDTPKRVAKVLAQAGKRRVPVLIDSAGGDADAAMEIGRMIAKRKLDVIVGGAVFEGCGTAGAKPCKAAKKNALLRGTVTAGPADCRGACVLVLAAGRGRIGGSELVVYRPSLFVSRAAPAQSAERVTAYLRDLNQEKLLARIQSESRDDPIRLAAEESVSLTLATAAGTAEAQFPADLCKAKPRPSPCVNR